MAMMHGSRFMQDMMKANKNGNPYLWGNLPNSNGAVEELGINGAMEEMRRGSPHRNSSGYTSELVKAGKSRKERNTIRRAHYVRKGTLEAEKERGRRAAWLRRHPGASEANWTRREAERKTRKAGNRTLRKALRARRSSSKKRTTSK